jgi:hypothetical protein
MLSIILACKSGFFFVCFVGHGKRLIRMSFGLKKLNPFNLSRLSLKLNLAWILTSLSSLINSAIETKSA